LDLPDFPPHPDDDLPVFDLPDLAAATYATMGIIGADVEEGVTGAGVGLSVTAAFTKPVVGSSVAIGLSVGDTDVGDELGTTVG